MRRISSGSKTITGGYLGIDEAGRGSVIGPLVVAGVYGDEELKDIGVKDSKELSPRRREELFEEIVDSYHVYVVELPPPLIDEYVRAGKLNVLEMEAAVGIIRESRAERVIVDSPDPNSERYGEEIARRTGVHVVSEHGAERYPVVAAASIVAKVLRDRRIREIEEEYGIKVGSGYPHDENTLTFLRANRLSLPPFVRRSWKTVRDMYTGTLEDWF